MKNVIQSLKVIALGLILAFGISYAFAWTAPTSNPPAGNVAAPINVSGSAQIKSGALSSSTSFDTPTGYFGKIGIGTSNPNAKLTVKDGDVLLKQNVGIGASGANTIGLSVDTEAGTGAAASIGILKETANNTASLIFKNWNGASTVETMRIKSNGDVVVAGKVCDSVGCIGSGGGGGTSLGVYLCPTGKTPGANPSGGDWGFYGCNGQITPKSSCWNIEWPWQETRPCNYLGTLQIN